MNRRLLLLVPTIVLLLAVSYALAACPHCASGCAPCTACQTCGKVQYVEKTVCVPAWVTELRDVVTCEYRMEQRQRTCTVYRCVPEVRTVERACTVMVPQTSMRTVQVPVCTPVTREVQRQYTVMVPEWHDVQREYTVMVPHLEKRQAVRRYCRMVPQQVTHKVTVDRGHWETQQIEVPCACGCGAVHHGCGSSCGSCGKVCMKTVCRTVWKPNLVQEDVTCTVCRPQIVEEPYEYTVTVCLPEKRSCTVKVCRMRPEIRTRTCLVTTYQTSLVEREIPCTVFVPKQKRWTQKVVCYRHVPEQVTQTYTVCVPHKVHKQIPVKVCRMAHKTVKVPVTSCCRGC